MKKLKGAIFISGRGSNMTALLKAAQRPDFPVEFRLVLSDNPDAAGLDYADRQGLKTAAVDFKSYGSKAVFEANIHEILDDWSIEMIALAGFMRILTADFIDRFDGPIFNIHPSLLPKYKGLNTHRRALNSGDKEHGCSVHLVTPGVDEGPVFGQAKVPIMEGDTEDSLAKRVLVEEHKLYAEVIRGYF